MNSTPKQRDRIVAAAIALLTLIVYVQVLGHEFIAFDDGTYIERNQQVRAGLTAEGIAWAFASGGYASNWHPITWISHMLDVTLFGLDAGWHHLMNVVFHIANTTLLFAFLRHVKVALWPAAFAAALFALHPLHVESVAWASERKDTLSTLFWLLTMFAYSRYTRAPSPKRYALVMLWLALGLMSKPMLVTMPFVLLLLDYWPLRREGATVKQLVVEKLPLLGIAVISMIVTVVAQDKGGAVQTLEHFDLANRFANATVSYGEYLWNTVWPSGLALFYPYPESIPTWQVGASIAVVLGLVGLGVKTAKTCPAILVGVLWYLGTLVPVIGIVQVGNQPLADRYTYVPLIGIFVAIAVAVPHYARAASTRKLLGGLGAAAIVACTVLTWLQVARWRDSETLFRHTLAVTEGNFLAHNNLGQVLFEKYKRLAAAGKQAEAQAVLRECADHFRSALPFTPPKEIGSAYHNLGSILEVLDELDAAKDALESALEARPGHAATLIALGKVLAKQNEHDEAIAAYRRAIASDAGSAPAYHRMSQSFGALDKKTEAANAIRKAIQLKPDDVAYRIEGSDRLVAIEAYGEAIRHLEHAIRLQPKRASHRNDLGSVKMLQGDPRGAAVEFQRAHRLNRRDAGIRANLGKALCTSGDFDAGVPHLVAAARSKDPRLLRFALSTLATFARQNGRALAALREIAGSGRGDAANLATQALQQIGR